MQQALKPIYIKGKTIEAVKEIRYLGANIEQHGGNERTHMPPERLEPCVNLCFKIKVPLRSQREWHTMPWLLAFHYGADTWATKAGNRRRSKSSTTADPEASSISLKAHQQAVHIRK